MISLKKQNLKKKENLKEKRKKKNRKLVPKSVGLTGEKGAGRLGAWVGRVVMTF